MCKEEPYRSVSVVKIICVRGHVMECGFVQCIGSGFKMKGRGLSIEGGCNG